MSEPEHSPPARQPSGVEYVFEKYSRTMPPMEQYLAGLWERRRFMVEMARADRRSQSMSTRLGELWNLLDPLIQAGIYFLLYTVIRGGSNQPGAPSLVETVTLIVACVFLFNFTRNVLQEGGRSILSSRSLMLNSTFPPALLPLAAVYRALLEFGPSAAVYAVLHIVTGRPLGQGLQYLPLLFALQVVMSLGIALIVATLTVYIRDMTNVMNYVLRLLIFVTPVIYPVGLLTPSIRAVLSWNPLFPLFVSYQTILTGGSPSLVWLVESALWAAFFLVVGARMFISRERSFALRI